MSQNLQKSGGWKAASRSNDPYHQCIRDCREMTETFLSEVYSLRQATDGTSQSYFDGHQVLFPSKASDFARLVNCVEELVEGYNEDLANELGQETILTPEGLAGVEPSNFIDTAVLVEAVTPAARQHTAFLVDMAKAEALDVLGENQAAVTVMERHV
jgi:hypothetical protein